MMLSSQKLVVGVWVLLASFLTPQLSLAAQAQIEMPILEIYNPALPEGHVITSAALSRDGVTILYTHAAVDGSDPSIVLTATDGSWTRTAPAQLPSVRPVDSRMVSDEGKIAVFLSEDGAWLWDIASNIATQIRLLTGITDISVSGNGRSIVMNYPDGIAYRIDRRIGLTHAVGGPMTFMDEHNRILSPVFTSRLEVHVWEVEGGGASWYYHEKRLCPEKIYRCNDGAADFILGQNTAGMIHEVERGAVYLELTRHLSVDDQFVTHDGATITLYDASAAHGFLREPNLEDMIAAPDYGPAQAEVVRLYQAYFDRAPDFEGVRYWLRIQAQGHDVQQIATWMSDQEEFANTYQGTSNAQYMTMVYSNVLGRGFDQAGYEYWLDLLDTGQLDRAGVVFWIAQNAEFIEKYPFL